MSKAVPFKSKQVRLLDQCHVAKSSKNDLLITLLNPVTGSFSKVPHHTQTILVKMSDIEKLIGKTLSECEQILESENIRFQGT